MHMSKRLKISPHHHTGRLQPHEHTSYILLAFLLLIVGFPLSMFTAYAASPPPQAGSIGLTGTVAAKPPAKAATIDEPHSGQHFGTTPVKIAGTCPANTLVEIFKNKIFAGSTPCDDKGTYSLDVDLMLGSNELIARVYDALNQAGPDSNVVTALYDALPPQTGPTTSFNFGGNQLLLNTNAVFRGTFPDQNLNVPISIIGGSTPYAINVDWGDATHKIVPRGDNATFNVVHAYKKPGTYQIAIQATDADGRVAFLTVASIVNGQPETAAISASGSISAKTNELLVLWPLYTSLIAVVASFWLGEQREKKLLSHPHQLAAS